MSNRNKIIAADLKPGDTWQRSNGYRVMIGAITTEGDEWSFQFCIFAPGKDFSEFAARHCTYRELVKMIGDGTKVEAAADEQ